MLKLCGSYFTYDSYNIIPKLTANSIEVVGYYRARRKKKV